MIKAIALPIDEDYDKKKYNGEHFATYCGDVFLHGEIEKRNGYDLVLLKETPKADGVYDVAVFMGDNGACKAKLYYWELKENKGYRFRRRGYIVLDNDADGKAYAAKKFAERSMYL